MKNSMIAGEPTVSHAKNTKEMQVDTYEIT